MLLQLLFRQVRASSLKTSTNNAEEETNIPGIAEMLRLDDSVVRVLEYQSKGRGFKSHSSRKFRT